MVLLAFGAAGAIGTLVMWWLMRSIGDLQRGTARLREGDLGARVSEKGEFAGLAACLNEMASSLQATTVSRVSLEKLIGAIDQIVVVSGQDDRVQLINLAAIERLGWQPGEVIGRQLREVMRGKDGAPDVELVAKDGTTRVVVCTPRTLHDPAGHPVGRVWIARDGVRV
jgi:signal transduction histidine kinase